MKTQKSIIAIQGDATKIDGKYKFTTSLAVSNDNERRFISRKAHYDNKVNRTKWSTSLFDLVKEALKADRRQRAAQSKRDIAKHEKSIKDFKSTYVPTGNTEDNPAFNGYNGTAITNDWLKRSRKSKKAAKLKMCPRTIRQSSMAA